MKISLNDAKLALENGSIDSISFNFFLGSLNCVILFKNGKEGVITTTRGDYKKYKSLDAIFKDYKFITSLELCSLKAGDI